MNKLLNNNMDIILSEAMDILHLMENNNEKTDAYFNEEVNREINRETIELIDQM